MTSKTNSESPKQISHRPFVIRKTIVLSTIAFAIVGGFLFGNLVLGIALYFGWVTLFDGLSHYVFHLKSSNFANPEALLKSERVTGEELDTYFDTRRNIRLISFGLACFALGEALIFSILPLEAFCVAYVLSTVCGILYVRFFVKIKRPQLFRLNKDYDNPPWPVPNTSANMDYVFWTLGYDRPLRSFGSPSFRNSFFRSL